MNISSSAIHVDLSTVRNSRHIPLVYQGLISPLLITGLISPLLITIEWITSELLQNDAYRLNDTMSSLLMFIMERAPGLAVRFLTSDYYAWIYEHICFVEISFNSPVGFVLLLILVDFMFYWHHRAMHELNIIWTVHQHHHSSEEFNLAAALRQPYLQGVYTGIFYTPLAFFADPTTMMFHLSLNSFYQFFIHSSYFKSLGPLEYIMNTPSHHRVHHARNPACIDRNYAGVFIIWDRMFGTFISESDVDDIAYGIVSNVNTFNMFKSQCVSIIQLIKKAIVTPGVSGKIKAVFYGPGWSTGKPRLGYSSDIPEVEHPGRVYDVKMPMWLKVYVFVHFVAFLCFERPLIAQHSLPDDMKHFILPILGLNVMLTVSVLGSIMDGNKLSSIMECFRCIVAICVQMFLWKPISSVHHVRGLYTLSNIYMYLIFMGASGVFWLVRIMYYQSGNTHYECTNDKCKQCRRLITKI